MTRKNLALACMLIGFVVGFLAASAGAIQKINSELGSRGVVAKWIWE